MKLECLRCGFTERFLAVTVVSVWVDGKGKPLYQEPDGGAQATVRKEYECGNCESIRVSYVEGEE